MASTDSSTLADEKKKYLEQLIMNAITVPSDEYEGQQVIDLNDINLCGADYIPTEEPYYTPNQINTLFHFNDPNIAGTKNKNNPNDGITGSPGVDDGVGKGSYPSSLYQNTDDMADENTKKGTDSGLISNGSIGNNSGNNNVNDNIEHNKYDFTTVAVPDDVNTDDIVNAIINDKTSSESNHAIVEFATPSLQDEKGVDYTLYVKPGQKLTSDTIIGNVTLNGVTKPIRSIFSSGTVLADETGKDFYHLYKSAGANRHIVIENFTYVGEIKEINTDAIDKIKSRFESEAYITELVTDNICESILPWILMRRYTSYKYKWGTDFMRVREVRPNGRELFGKYLKYVDKLRNDYLNDLKSLGSEDNIKTTKGNPNKVDAVGNSILDRRTKYVNDILYAYQEYKETIDKCEYDPEFSDCKYLALNHKIKEGKQDTYTKIGNTDYNNYYVALLSKVSLLVDNPYAKEYYELLKKIIEVRISREVYKIEDIAREFDSLYKKIVNKKEGTPYNDLYKEMKTLKKDITYNDVYSWITAKIRKKQDNSYTVYAVQQLTNIFLFCWNYKTYTPSVYKPSVKVSSYESVTYDISEEFYWSESAEFPYDSMNIVLRSFEDIKDGTFDVGPEKGKYSINMNGVTAWLRSKNEEEVVIYQPKLTDEQWQQLKNESSDYATNIYDLTKQEWNKISAFWEKMLTILKQNQISKILSDFKDMANTMDKYATWPECGNITIGYDTYDHYLFQNSSTVDNDSNDDYEGDMNYQTDAPNIPNDAETPDDQPTEFLDDNDDDVQDDEPTVKDFKYWRRYFALATIISLPFLNCGFDFPPTIMFIPMPCIFMCVAAVYIQVLDLTIVFGISIRGMYIWPIILFVNLSDQYANISTALIAQVKNIQSKINAKINSLLEAPITSIANGFINMLEEDNRVIRNENRQLDTEIDQIKAKKSDNEQKIKKDIQRIFKPNVDQTEQVIDPLKSEKVKNNSSTNG